MVLICGIFFSLQKTLLKKHPQRLHPNLRRHKSTFDVRQAKILLEVTREQRKGRLECGVHESSFGSGFSYFNFSDSVGDALVWRKSGMLSKAKDTFCGYTRSGRKRKRYSSEKRKRGLRRVKSLERSGENNLMYDVSRKERRHDDSPEQQRPNWRPYRISQESDLTKRSFVNNKRIRHNRNRLLNENIKNRSKEKRKHRRQLRCRKERDKFKQFMYNSSNYRRNNRSSVPAPWIRKRRSE